jgi:hypothetical protein
MDVRFEGFTAFTIKNVVFWDIKTQFVLHRRHITSPLQSGYKIPVCTSQETHYISTTESSQLMLCKI